MIYYKMDIQDVKKINVSHKCLEGKEKTLFLINDSNNEIMQHYDKNYINHFNKERFLSLINDHDKIATQHNSKYYFFCIPDKSIVCFKNLPFDIKHKHRNIDTVNHPKIFDFAKYLNESHYFKSDSHINYTGGLQYTKRIIEILNIDKDMFESKLRQFDILTCSYMGDLTDNINYKLPKDKNMFVESKIMYRNKNIIDLTSTIPEKLKLISTRIKIHHRNNEAITNYTLLIFRDSSTTYIYPFLEIIFKEIIIYCDHWSFNQELLKHFKPDYIFEMRTERFIEGFYNFI
jgi:hypothetical protein